MNETLKSVEFVATGNHWFSYTQRIKAIRADRVAVVNNIIAIANLVLINNDIKYKIRLKIRHAISDVAKSPETTQERLGCVPALLDEVRRLRESVKVATAFLDNFVPIKEEEKDE